MMIRIKVDWVNFPLYNGFEPLSEMPLFRHGIRALFAAFEFEGSDQRRPRLISLEDKT